MTTETTSPTEPAERPRSAASRPPLRILGADAVVCEGDSCLVPTGAAAQD
ncbi:hypothetical protein [Plantibacter sp. Leaf171]|nr:hypothetical protein [Plantibacter sp. Leaf171]